MTTTTTTPQPDLAAIKRRQQQVWASADYAAVAARIMMTAERLVEAADLRAGERVLDVATGSGNAALAAARCGCQVTGIDYVPGLLERGRARAAAEGLQIEFAEGDAEDLAFPDASFDAVLSCLGVMFAPGAGAGGGRAGAGVPARRHHRPGQLDAVGLHRPAAPDRWQARPTPAGIKPPSLWGTEERLRELLGGAVSQLEIKRRMFGFRFRSPEDFARFFRDNYGPVHKAFEALDEPGRGGSTTT